MPFVVTLLALVTSFILFGGIGYAHQSQMHQAQQANESETPAALAAPAVDVDLLSALTRRLADRRVNLSERLRIAAARQQWLADLIERHPAEVLRQALSPAERGSLAPEVQALVESEETHEGAIEVFHADGPQGSSYHYGLRKPSGQWLSLHFAADGPRVSTGTPVQVHGVRVQQAMALGSSSSVSVLGSPPLTNTLGEHKVLVALLTLTDTPAGAGATPVQVQSTMFGATASVSNYFREASYQQTWLTGTVVGPLPIAMSSAGCNYNQIATLAQQALAGIPSINIWNYNHVIYAFTGSGCTWWGFGSIGGSPGQVWINGAFQSVVASHELGHNFGLYHSHALECGTVTMGGSCSSVEYGDLFDVMGNGNGPTHYNAVQKDLLGWLDYGVSPPITEVVASGTYTIDGFEMPGVSPKALRIKTAVGDWLYVEYRRPVGFDSYLSSNANVSNGVIIHYWDGTGDGVYLLDMTPATSSWADPALAVGATFQDAAGKVTITPTSVNGTTATVNVTLGSTCVHAAPTVTLTPAQQQGQAGTTLTYTLTVRNNGAGCGVSVFTLQPTVPPGWTATPGVASVSLAEGATATTTLAVTSSASASPATYGLSLSTSESGLTGSAGASYTVTAPVVGGGPPGTSGSFADGFDRADVAPLDNGWSVVAGSLKIVSGEVRNDINKVLHVAVQPTLGGAVQTVGMAFASVSNNSAPRFGVVLRYRDSRNYYLCYRQIGGTSVVRIAKVVNGVETVLKSVGVTNPVQGALFTLWCQANGTGLTLQLDGVTKATATDTAFTTGSVGFAMGGVLGGAVSHRADNFSATAQ